MDNKKYLGKIVEVVIDRKLGDKHPRYDMVYEVNYGYVPNTISGDGEELDCYILGVDKPIDTFKGKCIAIIKRLDDEDDKLIIVPEKMNFTNDEIEEKIQFQEKYFKHVIIRKEV